MTEEQGTLAIGNRARDGHPTGPRLGFLAGKAFKAHWKKAEARFCEASGGGQSRRQLPAKCGPTAARFWTRKPELRARRERPKGTNQVNQLTAKFAAKFKANLNKETENEFVCNAEPILTEEMA